jgi:hypothetical protein
LNLIATDGSCTLLLRVAIPKTVRDPGRGDRSVLPDIQQLLPETPGGDLKGRFLIPRLPPDHTVNRLFGSIDFYPETQSVVHSSHNLDDFVREQAFACAMAWRKRPSANALTSRKEG